MIQWQNNSWTNLQQIQWKMGEPRGLIPVSSSACFSCIFLARCCARLATRARTWLLYFCSLPSWVDHVTFETTQAPKEAERGHLPYRSYSVPLLGPGTPEILSWMGLDFIRSPWTHGKMATGLSENTQENSDSSSCSPLKSLNWFVWGYIDDIA